MIKSTKNQLGNADNPHQGYWKRVLCVCSAGVLRSPTMAKALAEEFEYNTRSCGVTTEFALIPVSEALVSWADEIVFAEQVHMDVLSLHTDLSQTDCIVLGIPDEYDYMDLELQELILKNYVKKDCI